ncbi:MAG TPA: GNAT family N-acetyltransferase, partial [Bacteroidales bacterium]|nr:GNAT family N-acetyltransferase [Bacteroidales bacterium]HQH14153.1 GNAT family N-acetyltransferase [Bacteroidales bacterium]
MQQDQALQITVKEASPEDKEMIIGFQIDMAWETEKVKLDENTIRIGVQNVFKNPNLGRYYVAKANNLIVASLLITYEWSDWRNSIVLWIQSVYVIPKYRKRGVFRKMYENIKQQVERDNEIAGIRLYMVHNNRIA